MSVRVQREDFDLAREVDALKKSCGDAGAVVTFTGLVRGDGGVTSMSLEHYPGMTEREIARHVKDAEVRWALLGVTIIHRVGTLLPGDNIVLVAVAAAHRRLAFEAVEFLMDYLKTRAPFWKREEGVGESSWVHARESDEVALRRWRRD